MCVKMGIFLEIHNNMSEAFLNQVTLDCLLNKNMYNKHLLAERKKTTNKRDKKFYKRRIFDLTKELLLTKEEPDNLFPDVKYSFDIFVDSCIHYFKSKDNNDIIQAEYKNIEEMNVIESDLLELNVESPLTEEEANTLLMRSFKITQPSLDNFVKIKYTKSPCEIILPKQKDINLKDPDLRNKGIRKKKNIMNKYDESVNSKKEITETIDKEK
jgi:hypothetical protein